MYAGPARRVVAAWKEHGLRRAGTFAAELVTGAVPRPAADVIAYIPPDPHRQLVRGRHPAEGLALELGERWQMVVAPLLRRASGHASGRQAALARADRLRSARRAYTAVEPAPRRVVLIDDVYTTGATAHAAAAALRSRGAESVEVVTFARTTRL